MRYSGNEMMFYWRRGEILPLSPYFTTKEFECRCGVCLEQQISVDLVLRLTRIRERRGKAIGISSGFRCSRYQAELRKDPAFETAKNKSTHEEGKAADITYTDMVVIQTEFTAIGAAASFTHVDIRPGAHHWTYQS